LEHVEYDFSSERALLGEESGVKSASVTSAAGGENDPARLMVAAACACAEQAERNRGATQSVTPFFSPDAVRGGVPPHRPPSVRNARHGNDGR
jgi:hypothetical protein